MAKQYSSFPVKNKLALFFAFLVLQMTSLHFIASGQPASVAGDYRTRASGLNWTGTTTWQKFMLNTSGVLTWTNVPYHPTDTSGLITIQVGHSITLTSAITVDQLYIANSTTSRITINPIGSLTLLNGSGDDLTFLGASGSVTVNGLLKVEDGATINNSSISHLIFNDNATLQWNYTTSSGTVPEVFLDFGSTLAFTGGNATQTIGATNTDIYNLTVSSSSLISLSGSNNTYNIEGTLSLGSGSLSIGANTLAPFADITTAGGLLIGGTNSNITFSGSGDATLPSVSGGLNDLTISKSDISDVVTIDAATTVYGILTLDAGTLSPAGNLTLDLDSGAISADGVGNIDSDITILKTGTAYGLYHQISSPVAATAGEINNNLPITGFYSYDETNPSVNKEDGWTAVNNTSTVLNFMQGYTLYFPSATTLSITGQYTHDSIYGIATTYTSSGTPFTDGWNLIGNPYPSPIDWDASGWTKNNIDGAVYIWNAESGIYESYVGGVGNVRIIPSLQGFWVKASANDTVKVTNDVRIVTSNPALYRIAAIDNLLKLTCSSGRYSDYTYLRVYPLATLGFDSQLDAYKLSSSGNTPTFSSFLGQTSFSINTLPEIVDTLLIPLKIKAAFDGMYTISASGLSSFGPQVGAIYLTDKLLGKKQDLLLQPEYITTISASDTSGRFFINFVNNQITGTAPSTNSYLYVRSSEKQVDLKMENYASAPATVHMTDLQGKEVLRISDIVLSSDWNTLHTNLDAGLYLIWVTTAEGTYMNKIFMY